MDSIKEGDTVQLRSGGPIMTAVGESMLPGSWVCEWFDAKNNPKQGQFALTSLVKVQPKNGPGGQP
jgi:uncharacterized protein YodC (DUF2158 family)